MAIFQIWTCPILPTARKVWKSAGPNVLISRETAWGIKIYFIRKNVRHLSNIPGMYRITSQLLSLGETPYNVKIGWNLLRIWGLLLKLRKVFAEELREIGIWFTLCQAYWFIKNDVRALLMKQAVCQLTRVMRFTRYCLASPWHIISNVIPQHRANSVPRRRWPALDRLTRAAYIHYWQH